MILFLRVSYVYRKNPVCIRWRDGDDHHVTGLVPQSELELAYPVYRV